MTTSTLSGTIYGTTDLHVQLENSCGWGKVDCNFSTDCAVYPEYYTTVINHTMVYLSDASSHSSYNSKNYLLSMAYV